MEEAKSKADWESRQEQAPFDDHQANPRAAASENRYSWDQEEDFDEFLSDESRPPSVKELADVALSLQSIGLNPIPLKQNKSPFLHTGELKDEASGFYHRRSNERDIETWLKRERDCRYRNWWGLGVVTGHTTGLFTVDRDSRKAQRLLDMLGVTENLVDVRPSWKTGRGLQWAFQIPEDLTIPTIRGFLPGVDIKGDGGYAVLPPTIHPKGIPYRYMTDFWESKPMEAPPALIAAIRLSITGEVAGDSELIPREIVEILRKGAGRSAYGGPKPAMPGENPYQPKSLTLSERLDRHEEVYCKKTTKIKNRHRNSRTYEDLLNAHKKGLPEELLLPYGKNIRDFKAEESLDPHNPFPDSELQTIVDSVIKRVRDDGMTPNENFVYRFRKGFDPNFGTSYVTSKEAFLEAVMDKVLKVGEIKGNSATIKTSWKNLIEDTRLTKNSLRKQVEEWEKQGHLKVKRTKNGGGGDGYTSYTFILGNVEENDPPITVGEGITTTSLPCNRGGHSFPYVISDFLKWCVRGAPIKKSDIVLLSLALVFDGDFTVEQIFENSPYKSLRTVHDGLLGLSRVGILIPVQTKVGTGERIRRKDKTYRLSPDVFPRLHEYLTPGKEKIKATMVKNQNERDENRRLRLAREYRLERLQEAIFDPHLTGGARYGRWPLDRGFWREQSRATTYDTETLEHKLKT